MKSITGLLPEARYFESYLNQGNDSSRVIDMDGIKIFVPAERYDNKVVIHPKTFAADFYSDNFSTIGYVEFKSIFKRVCDLFREEGAKSIDFKGIPAFISDFQIKGLEGISKTQMRTSVVSLSNYSPSSRRKRNIKKGAGLTFNPRVSNLTEIENGWNSLTTFIGSRGLEVITIQRLNFLLETFPDRFAIATATDCEGNIHALALTHKVGECLRLPNYFSDRDYVGAIDFLIDAVIRNSIQENLEIVDLGVSTDPNLEKEIEGIVNFKAEFGAKRELIHKYHFEL
jgi:hypothetical protein